MDVSAIPALSAELLRNYPFLEPAHANRLAHAYGTRAGKVLGNARSMADLGQSFGASLTESEVRYLISVEWARTAEDIVWRRSKLGLRLSMSEIAAIDQWISAMIAPPLNVLCRRHDKAHDGAPPCGENGLLTRISLLTIGLLKWTCTAALIAVAVTVSEPAPADDAAAQKWIDTEFQPSTLSKADQLKELQWFEKAAQPFKGMDINIVSETLPTHEYESRTLARAFTELTGIKVKHDRHRAKRCGRKAADPDPVRQEHV